MRTYKLKLIRKLRLDMRVIKLVAYKYRMMRPGLRRHLMAELDKTWGNGPSDFNGLAGILGESDETYSHPS